MRGYLLRRLLAAPLLLLGVVTLTFLLVHASPGEPFAAERAAGTSPEAAARLRAIFGTDAPLHERYLQWLLSVARLDFGVSFTHRRPALSVLSAALGPTLLLMGSALALAVVLGTTTACAAAMLRSRPADRVIASVAVAAYSTPSFWIGVLLVQGASVWMGWLPASGWRSIDAPARGLVTALLDLGRHLLLPCLTLAVPAAAGIALHLRASLASSLAGTTSLAARARGASRLRVIALHLRNASASVVTLLGFAFPGLVGGSLVVEVLFAWPGMGRVTYEAILARDLPVILASVALTSAVTLAGSLAADLGCALADRRVALESRA
ncbi:MAG: ABC transporter permease [Candidatus Polarisedimenticolia bacterium]